MFLGVVQSLNIIRAWSGTRRTTVSGRGPSRRRPLARGRFIWGTYGMDIYALAWLAADVLFRPVKAYQRRRRRGTLQGSRASRGRFHFAFYEEIIYPLVESWANRLNVIVGVGFRVGWCLQISLVLIEEESLNMAELAVTDIAAHFLVP